MPPASPYIHGNSTDEQRRLTRMQGLLNEAELATLDLEGVRTILDVGAGLGQMTRVLARAVARTGGPGAWVLGVERDPAQIAEALRQAGEAGEPGATSEAGAGHTVKTVAKARPTASATLPTPAPGHVEQAGVAQAGVAQAGAEQAGVAQAGVAQAGVELRQGEAERLPLGPAEWGTFDVAHARFLLEHVRDPLAVVKQMTAAVRPGGRVFLLDDDHELLRFWPPPPAPLWAAWEAYWRSYARHGCDPLVGRRLPALLAEAGAPPVRVTTVFFGASLGLDTFPDVVDNLHHVLQGAAPGLAEAGLLPAEAMAAALGALAQWRSLPGAAVWYSLPFAEGRRPR